MVSFAFALFVIATLVFSGLCKLFIEALKEENPYFYPTVFRYIWRKQLFMPFSKLILFRAYRGTLKDCPRSLAWGSWLFVAHWVQLLAVALLALSALR